MGPARFPPRRLCCQIGRRARAEVSSSSCLQEDFRFAAVVSVLVLAAVSDLPSERGLLGGSLGVSVSLFGFPAACA